MASGGKQSNEAARVIHQSGGLDPSANPAPPGNPGLVIALCILLAAITWAVFGQTIHYPFVNFDDDRYVYDNPEIKSGLTSHGVRWAFTHSHGANWHPLTSLSHMVDCQLYGLNAGRHHATNVVLHTATAIVLFLVLRRMTATLWASAFVAALFAVHPLRVESVAWIAERKDVLSGLFFMLTIGAYGRYVKTPRSVGRYLSVVFLFALGLLCKPTLVVLPFILLLLDYWPLCRQGVSGVRYQVSGGESNASWFKLVLEKLPLFALSAAAAIVTFLVQRSNDAVRSIEHIPVSLRIANALVSSVAYLWQMISPTRLAAYYPYPVNGVPVLEIILAVLVLAALSVTAFLWRQKRPWFLVGWLWYLGALLPVIGLVQVGSQARADRYTYLSQIGIYLLLTWTLKELAAAGRARRYVFGGLAVAELTILAVCTRIQTGYWQDSESLWVHTIACTPPNTFARYELGNALHEKGRLDEATTCYLKAIEIDPGNVPAHYSLGNVYYEQRRIDAAIAEFRAALQLKPDYADAHVNLANALLNSQATEEAILHYREALKIQRDQPRTLYNLGNALLRQGQIDEATACYQKALELRPDFSEAHNNLGTALLQQRKPAEAASHFQKAINLKPDYGDACKNLAWILATCPDSSLRNGSKAVELAEQANRLSRGEDPLTVVVLAAAYAEARRFPEAVEVARRGQRLAAAQNSPLAEKVQSQIDLYQAGLAFRDTSLVNSPAP